MKHANIEKYRRKVMKSNNDKIDNINNKMVKSKVMSVNIKEQDGTMLNASSSVLSPKWTLVKETFINNKKLRLNFNL